jgi:hypothetical protein
VSNKFPILQPKAIRALGRITRNENPDQIERTANPKNILIFASRQAREHLAWNTTIGKALVMRGHRVTVVGCDRFIQMSCNSGHFPELTDAACKNCFLYASQHAKSSGLETRWLGDYAEPEDGVDLSQKIDDYSAEQINNIEIDGLPIGEYARASVTHYMKTGVWLDDLDTRNTHAEFVKGASRLIPAIKRFIADVNPDSIFMLNGWFLPERIVFEYARRQEIDVTTYENGFFSNSLFFDFNDIVTYDTESRWDKIKHLPLTPSQEGKVDQLINDRRRGSGMSLNTDKNVDTDWQNILTSVGLSPEKPTAVMFTNVTWDSTLWAGNIAFNDMFAWVDSAIKYFETNPQQQMIIRVHPAEIHPSTGTRYPMTEYIRTNHPNLAKNIALVPPGSTVNSYTLIDNADVVLIYSSTVGIEASALGKPVILSGGVHYRQKGFTQDVNSEQEFQESVSNRLSNPNSEDLKELSSIAKQYLFHLFFRASVPFQYVQTNGPGTRPNITYTSSNELLPGNDLNLDAICEGIISGHAATSATQAGDVFSE